MNERTLCQMEFDPKILARNEWRRNQRKAQEEFWKTWGPKLAQAQQSIEMPGHYSGLLGGLLGAIGGGLPKI